MGDFIFSTVKNAAKLAVYVAIIIKAKNHQTPVNNRVEVACGASSVPIF